MNSALISLDDDFVAFIAVDSETDSLPAGSAKEFWDPEAVLVQDREIERAEALYKEEIHRACHRVIERFDTQ